MVEHGLWEQPDELLALGNEAFQAEEHGKAIHYYAGALIASAGFELLQDERFADYPTANGFIVELYHLWWPYLYGL